MTSEIRLKAFIDLAEPINDEKIIRWAMDNINEDPDTKEQVICDLRDLIFEKGECTPHRTDDAFFLKFLRARYFNVKMAHRLMVNYYTFKEEHPEYFKGMDFARIKKLTSTNIICVPPCRDQENRRMLIHRIGLWDPTEFTTEELIYVTTGIIEIGLMEPIYQLKGGVFILDLEDLSLNQAWQMTPTIASHIVHLVIRVIPFRLEAIHILHQSRLFDVAYNVLIRFLPPAMQTRIFFHGEDMESLHAHIHPSHLPKRYGGVHLDYPASLWFDDVLKHNDKMIQDLIDLGYDEIEELRRERDQEEE